MAKIRSNLHTGQSAGSVPSEHSQGQALVEPLSLPGGFFARQFKKETVDLPHTPMVLTATG